jgi:hypothetical protein
MMRGSYPENGERFISFSKFRDRFWGPLSQLVPRAVSPGGGVNRRGHEADHRLLSGAKVKNEWSHTSTFPCIFMGFYFLKHGDKFTWNLGLTLCPLLKRLQCSSLYAVPYSRECNVVPCILSLTQETAMYLLTYCSLLNRLQCISLYNVPSSRDCNVVPYILSLTEGIAV